MICYSKIQRTRIILREITTAVHVHLTEALLETCWTSCACVGHKATQSANPPQAHVRPMWATTWVPPGPPTWAPCGGDHGAQIGPSWVCQWGPCGLPTSPIWVSRGAHVVFETDMGIHMGAMWVTHLPQVGLIWCPFGVWDWHGHTHGGHVGCPPELHLSPFLPTYAIFAWISIQNDHTHTHTHTHIRTSAAKFWRCGKVTWCVLWVSIKPVLTWHFNARMYRATITVRDEGLLHDSSYRVADSTHWKLREIYWPTKFFVSRNTLAWSCRHADERRKASVCNLLPNLHNQIFVYRC